MSCLTRFVLATLLVLSGSVLHAQEATVQPTSATDHKVRIEKTKRIKTDEAEQRHGKSMKKKKAVAGSLPNEAKVYKRHRHFAARDIRLRSKSKLVRKEALGIGGE